MYILERIIEILWKCPLRQQVGGSFTEDGIILSPDPFSDPLSPHLRLVSNCCV